MDRSFDAIVVGSGATGGLAAKQLTAGGLRVALLEAGGPASESDARLDPDEAAERQRIQSRCFAYEPEASHLFVDDVDNPYSCPDDVPFNWIRGRQLCGRLHTWARASVRMSDYQLKAASRDGRGEDWPISYADLAPHYDLVERHLEVTGRRAGLPQLPDGQFLAPPPRSTAEQRLTAAVEAAWPTRAVTTARLAGAPVSAALEAAAGSGRLTLLSNSIVRRVLTGNDGSEARGVAYVDRHSGSEHEVEARLVLLCASTIESTRILLNSASSEHPAGLGNSSGVLGRFLMDHTFGISVEGVVPRAVGGEEGLQGDCVTPAFRNITEPDVEFLRGYSVQTHFRPAERRRFHRLRRLVRLGQTRFFMQSFGEVLPRFENRVTLEPGAVDAWGIPTVRIECRYGENERQMAADQLRCSLAIAAAAGFEVDGTSADLLPPGSSVHELGTARMGADPASSVLNRHNQCWDVPNLFVTDGAAFTSSGFQNPTLTMMALTSRACDFALARLRDGSGFIA